jgi:hypothetical protein
MVPVLKFIMDLFTDTDGIIANVTANTSVNGTATSLGASELLLWQWLPYLVGAGLILYMFKYVLGTWRQRKKEEDQYRR